MAKIIGGIAVSHTATMRSPTRAAAAAPCRRCPANRELAQHIGASLVMEEFDMCFFQDKPLDHGFFSPMSMLLERQDGQWPTRIELRTQSALATLHLENSATRPGKGQ